MLLATVFQPVSAADILKESATKTATPQMGFAFDEPEQETSAAPKADPEFTADFAVVTTQATGELAAIHHRTPVMLNPEQAKRWLYTTDPAELEAMMAPEAVMKVQLIEVSDAVNSSRNDGPECIKAPKR